jgi:hypothetical protein
MVDRREALAVTTAFYPFPDADLERRPQFFREWETTLICFQIEE